MTIKHTYQASRDEKRLAAAQRELESTVAVVNWLEEQSRLAMAKQELLALKVLVLEGEAQSIEERVIAAMIDGEWHDALQISEAISATMKATECCLLDLNSQKIVRQSHGKFQLRREFLDE